MYLNPMNERSQIERYQRESSPFEKNTSSLYFELRCVPVQF